MVSLIGDSIGWNLLAVQGKRLVPMDSVASSLGVSVLLNRGASPVVAQRQLRHADPLTPLRN